jgi:hypothetical protein
MLQLEHAEGTGSPTHSVLGEVVRNSKCSMINHAKNVKARLVIFTSVSSGAARSEGSIVSCYPVGRVK